MTDLALSMGDRGILLLPIDETSPGEASPYSALSVFAIDPIYIGLDGLAGVAPRQVERVRRALAHVPLSDRLTIRAARRESARGRVSPFHGARRRARGRDAFATRHRGWLDDYALFRALKDRFDFAPWEDWPGELRRRETGCARSREGRTRAGDRQVRLLAVPGASPMGGGSRPRGVRAA